MITKEWVDDTIQRMDRNQPVFPDNREQLDWLLEQYPEESVRWLPPRGELHHLNLPGDFEFREQPLDEIWQERFLVTLTSDTSFRQAVMTALTIDPSGGAE